MPTATQIESIARVPRRAAGDGAGVVDAAGVGEDGAGEASAGEDGAAEDGGGEDGAAEASAGGAGEGGGDEDGVGEDAGVQARALSRIESGAARRTVWWCCSAAGREKLGSMEVSRRSILLGSLVAGCQREPARPSGEAPAASASAISSSEPPAPAVTTLQDIKPLYEAMARLAPHHRTMPAPRPGDWLASHPEAGQSFEDYLRAKPTLPTAQRRVLVVQPLGSLSEPHERVLSVATAYLEAFFRLPTRKEPALPLADVPKQARRGSRGFGEQLLTTHLLRKVLAPRLPADAMAYLAFTASDLWPGEDWNYVFGEASLDARVGVWSLARNGDPASPATARLAAVRALKIASHEAGHMFGIEHCTAYLCVMAGTNSLDESDAHPTWLCPKCLAKVCWATGTPPSEHLRRVREFARAHELREEDDFYTTCLGALGA